MGPLEDLGRRAGHPAPPGGLRPAYRRARRSAGADEADFSPALLRVVRLTSAMRALVHANRFDARQMVGLAERILGNLVTELVEIGVGTARIEL